LPYFLGGGGYGMYRGRGYPKSLFLQNCTIDYQLITLSF
jgi:hypothetical protein